jgi:hypothetical protein
MSMVEDMHTGYTYYVKTNSASSNNNNTQGPVDEYRCGDAEENSIGSHSKLQCEIGS